MDNDAFDDGGDYHRFELSRVLNKVAREFYEFECSERYKAIWDAVQANRAQPVAFKSGEKAIIEERIAQSMTANIDYDYWIRNKPSTQWQPDRDPFDENRKFLRVDEEQDVSSDDCGLSAVQVNDAPLVQA